MSSKLNRYRRNCPTSKSNKSEISDFYCRSFHAVLCYHHEFFVVFVALSVGMANAFLTGEAQLHDEGR